MAFVRGFHSADREALLALAPRLAEGVAPWRDPAAVGAAVTSWVDQSFDDPQVTLLVAEENAAVVGFVSVRGRQHWSGVWDAYIGELAVDRGVEGRGIGRALVEAVRGWAQQRDLAVITLETGAANAKARRFYTALGFHEEDVRLTLRLGD